MSSYNGKLISTLGDGAITFNNSYISISAPVYSSTPSIESSGNFYINSTENKLYKSDGLVWAIEASKTYYITSPGKNYDNVFISTTLTGVVGIDSYNSVIAPAYTIAPVVGAADTYYINSTTNILYKSNGAVWSAVSTGKYYLNSTEPKYDDKFVDTSLLGIISFLSVFFEKIQSKPNKFYLISYVNYIVTNIFNEDKFEKND